MVLFDYGRILICTNNNRFGSGRSKTNGSYESGSATLTFSYYRVLFSCLEFYLCEKLRAWETIILQETTAEYYDLRSQVMELYPTCLNSLKPKGKTLEHEKSIFVQDLLVHSGFCNSFLCTLLIQMRWPVLQIRIRDPVAFYPWILDPGWLTNLEPQSGLTTRIIFPRALKKFFWVKIL